MVFKLPRMPLKKHSAGEHESAGPALPAHPQGASFAGEDAGLAGPTGDPETAVPPSAAAQPGAPATLAFRAPLQRARLALARQLRKPLPLIGGRPLTVQLHVLAGFTAGMLVLALLVVVFDLRQASNAAVQAELTGELMLHSQRLAKAVPNAVQGNPQAFVLLRDSRPRFAASLALLTEGGQQGNRSVASPSGDAAQLLAELGKLWTPTSRAASVVLDNEAILTGIGTIVRRINEGNPQLLELTEQIAAARLQGGASAREIAESSRLVMLTQRIAKNVNELLTSQGDSPEIAFLLGKDTNSFRDLVESMALTVRRDPDMNVMVGNLQKEFVDVQRQLGGLLANQQSITAAKLAQQLVFRDNEALRERIAGLQARFAEEDGIRLYYIAALIVTGSLALLGALLIGRLYLDDSAARALEAERRSVQARGEEEQARRQNEANQTAIKRLMDELQEVADGNLSAQATVSEDITGAIADSVNYTLEELRGLVARINKTAAQVTRATTEARETSERLLQAARQEALEIRQTGEAVLHMAGQINLVSTSAAESAGVARESLAVATRGREAVANSISGMDEIREQIQETSKRIKRLGESSQEIGEITELISDITEQTNVLALNAAIQAASAGEAGRGFSVVAEEVQRLAERSAEATRQIGALVRTIQTDTQDAVFAMEKSTEGVVAGTRLSDAAGQALTDIDRVSRQLAGLIENISATTSSQAVSAGEVARSIEHILRLSEDNAEGTQNTSGAITQLSVLVDELRISVARFKVA